MNNKCRQCGAKMQSRRENRKYDCGLDNVTLVGVRVYHCAHCGEEEIEIPAVLDLHRVMAFMIAEKSVKLTPKEIRYLRTYLGLSGAEFARRMGVSSEAVSKWERVDKPLGMKTATERLLRLMVLHERSTDTYSLDRLAETAVRPPKSLTIRAKSARKGWHTDVTA